jgi:hypothetical protein
VDVGRLTRALADEVGRGYFVDAWLLRETLQEEMALEAAPPPRRAQARHAPAGPRGWMLPAAVALASLVGGGIAGYRLAEMADPRASAETALTAPATVAPARPVSSPSFPVPAPTRAIPIEFNADTSIGGGD